MDSYLRRILIYLEQYNISDEHRDVYFKLSQITPHVYISNLKEAVNIPYVQKENLQCILYLGDTPKSDKSMRAYESLGITHKFIQIQDSNIADITSVFDECYDYIHTAVCKNTRVLIHCSQGVSRSSTIVILYFLRLWYEVCEYHKFCDTHKHCDSDGNCKLFTILRFVKSKRQCIEPNSNFIQQLIHEEKRLQKIYCKDF